MWRRNEPGSGELWGVLMPLVVGGLWWQRCLAASYNLGRSILLPFADESAVLCSCNIQKPRLGTSKHPLLMKVLHNVEALLLYGSATNTNLRQVGGIC